MTWRLKRPIKGRKSSFNRTETVKTVLSTRTDASQRRCAKPSHLLALPITAALFWSGCATAPLDRPQAFDPAALPYRAEARGLEIAVEPVTSKAVLNKTFSVDLVRKGILPVRLWAANRSPEDSFVLARDSVRLTTAEGNDAPDRSGGEVIDHTIGTAFAIPAAALGSLPLLFVATSSEVRRNKINRNFRVQEFVSQTLSPGEEDSGFLYFQLPKAAGSSPQWRLVAVSDDLSRGEQFTIEIPIQIDPDNLR